MYSVPRTVCYVSFSLRMRSTVSVSFSQARGVSIFFSLNFYSCSMPSRASPALLPLGLSAHNLKCLFI